MPRRRDVIGLLGATAGAAAVGLGAAVSGTSGDDGDDHDHGGGSGGGDSAVAYVRNVEEVRGHLTSSVELLDRGREDDAALHASHGPDYFAPVLTPVRDEEPALATRLRGLLRSASERISTSDAEEYEQFVTEDVFPLLDDAVAAVVAEETRDSVAFDVRVMDALAGRIAEEYAAAVPEAGTVELAGEYWDGRGFLTRIEHRHEAVGDDLDDATAGALALSVLLYDGVFKGSAAGFLFMGASRGLNVLLGVAAAGVALIELPTWVLAVPVLVSLYIAGVTYMAEGETDAGGRGPVLAAMAGAVAATLGVVALVAVRQPPPVEMGLAFVFLIGFLVWVGRPLRAAYADPAPDVVGPAVGACVLGLSVLDAAFAAVVGAAWATAALAFVVPAVGLSRAFDVT